MIRLFRWSHAESLSTTADGPLEEEAPRARIAKCPDCASTTNTMNVRMESLAPRCVSAIARYFERTAITSISANAHGAANAATCIAALAGLLGCSAVPKYCVYAACSPAKSSFPSFAGSPAR